MKTLLSSRRLKFYSIVKAANEQTSEWLVSNLMNPGAFQSQLAMLACLRVLAYREVGSGLPYVQRKQVVKERIRKLANIA